MEIIEREDIGEGKLRNIENFSTISNRLEDVLLTANPNLFSVKQLQYSEKIRNLDVTSSGEVKSTKYFPIFEGRNGEEMIFKPLSKTKPYLTPLYAYAEVFWSNMIHDYFDTSIPLYQLAQCEGIEKEQAKYYEKGVIVPSFLNKHQKLVNLLEYFRENPDPKVDIDKYINYCMIPYDYTSILDSEVFKNTNLGQQLVGQILLSVLTRNQNFHYENIGFIYEGDNIISLTPLIDHEFSSLFLFPDAPERSQFYDSTYDLAMVHEDGIIFRNLLFITIYYPELVKKFLENLEKMSQDVQNMKFKIDDVNYVDRFNSNSFEIGHARFKDKDESKAQELEQSMKRYSIDLDSFFLDLKQKILKNNTLLKSLLSSFLELKSLGKI